MEINKQRLLKLLGLMGRMETKPFGFSSYVRPSYRGSPEAERDEVHRMFEITLLHQASGIRVGCLAEEDYYGEKVEYVVMSNFHVITRDGKHVSVVDVDMSKEEVITNTGSIKWSDLSRDPE